MTFNVYIATGLDNAREHNVVRDILRSKGVGLTYDWTVHGSAPERVAEVAELERTGVQEADAVVVLLPGGRGTHAELGMAIAWCKPVIICADEALAADVFERTPKTCAFYWAKGVRFAVGLDDLVDQVVALAAGSRR